MKLEDLNYEINEDLIATKPKNPRDESNLLIFSKKPNIIRNKIVELFGDIPRIELFARQTVEGWDSWGNQV